MNAGLTLRATQALLDSELLHSYFPRARMGSAHPCCQALLTAISTSLKKTQLWNQKKDAVTSLFPPQAETCRDRFPAEGPVPQLSGRFIPVLISRLGGSIHNVLAMRRSGGDGGEGGKFICRDDGVTPSNEKLLMIKTMLETVCLHFKGALSQPEGSSAQHLFLLITI